MMPFRILIKSMLSPSDFKNIHVDLFKANGGKIVKVNIFF